MAGKGGKGALGRHAFKVLCPESLVSNLIGPRGATKDELQAETGCRLVFSHREEFYPGTKLQVLIIYSDQPQGIIACLDRVVGALPECVQQEQMNHGDPQEFLGKEPGEYMLRAAIPTKASGAIIGPKGVNIQALREEFHARVFIDKGIWQGHQVVKVVAGLENMRHTIVRISEAVQEDFATDVFREWAAVRSFPGDGEAGIVQESHKGGPPGELSLGKGGGKPRFAVKREREPDAPAEGRDAFLQVLAETLAEFPDGVLEEAYEMTCDLPRAKVSALIGKSGDHVRSVRKVTGTNVRFDEAPGQDTQTMHIKGRLMDTWRAHAMMMRRYHVDDLEPKRKPLESDPRRHYEGEREEPEQKRPNHGGDQSGKIQGLQAQLDELQKQLALVVGNTGKGSGKKGK